MIATPLPLWFGHGDQDLLFYPFGIKRKGYRVAGRRAAGVERWTRLRAHLPLALLTLGFLPFALWGASWSGSGRLTLETLGLALAALVVATLAGGWLIDRVMFAVLLRDCPRLNRAPTRSEQQASSGRVGQTFANRNAAPLLVRWSCLAVGLVTILLGLHGGDLWLALSGLLLGGLFAFGAVRDSCERIHHWLLFDASSFETVDR